MIRRFLDYIAIERNYSPRTVSAYHADLDAFCAFLKIDEDAFDPRSIDENEIREWMADMMDHGQTARSVNRRLSSLRSFYRWMLRQQIVSRDITQRIIAPKISHPLPVFFRDSVMQEVTAFEQQADDFESVRDSLIIEMLYQTGMRRAETIALTDKDIDLRQGQIRIFGKRRKERIVPIGERLIAQIQDYLTYRNDFGECGTFFVRKNRNGEVVPLSESLLYNIVRKRMDEVTTQHKKSPHVLRHTFATTMLSHGADIRTIQTLMGHSSLAATQVYTHTTFDQILKTYKQAHPRAKKGD